MHTTKDPNPLPSFALWLNHNSDWSGDVIITVEMEIGPSRAARGLWTVDAHALIGGRVAAASTVGMLGLNHAATIPAAVLLRATALAGATFASHFFSERLEDVADRYRLAALGDKP